MLKQSVLMISLVFGATLLAGGTLAPTVAVAQAKVSQKVGKPLQEALDAANKGQYAQALSRLKAADAVGGKSAYEQFKINETYGFVYLKQRNYPAAAAAYERSLASGQLPGGQVNDRIKQLAQLHFQSPRNLPKVIEYSQRYLKATGGRDSSMNAMLGQAYQLSGNDKAAIAAVQNAIRVAGRPEENWLRILLKSYGKLNDAEGVSRTTMQLVQNYPSKDNWRLLSTELRQQASGDDRVALNVYRLMAELDLMDKPEVFSEAAIVAMESNVPAEAVRIMERAFASNVIAAADPRGKKIFDDAKRRTAVQQPNLTKIAQTAASSRSGEQEVLAGNVLLSYGQADKAIAAGKRALQEGANADDAWMLIGRGYLAQKNGTEARKAFNQVKGADVAAMARLWGIYASRI